MYHSCVRAGDAGRSAAGLNQRRVAWFQWGRAAPAAVGWRRGAVSCEGRRAWRPGGRAVRRGLARPPLGAPRSGGSQPARGMVGGVAW